jgi:CBS domain containing-hemolysin-like protein
VFEIGIRLLAVLLLVALNGFFVAAEFALVATRRSRVEQLIEAGNPLARGVQHALDHMNAYLAVAQLGITMASLGLGWIGEPAIAALLEPLFHFLPAEQAFVTSHALAVIIAFALITALHITLGEQAPKMLAIQRPEGVSLVVSIPMRLTVTLFRPAVMVLNGISNFFLALLRLPPTSEHEMVHSAEEIRYLVTASRKAGVLDEVEGQMVNRVFDFGETRIYEVMVPRTEIVGIEADSSLEEALARVAEEGRTRLPVYERDLDHIVGILHLRDAVRALHSGQEGRASVRAIARAPLVVPETASIEDVLKEMRERRTQMAIVIDEHGGTAGLATLEDLLEEIVGEVQDEFERPHEPIRPQPDGSVLLDGLVAIWDVQEQFNVELPEDEGYNTVGGLVMARLGRVPHVGDHVAVDGVQFQVEAMDGHRVATVRMSRT